MFVVNICLFFFQSPSGIQRKRSFNKNAESAFTQQVVNEGNGNNLQVPRKRISPANSVSLHDCNTNFYTQ